MSPLHDQDFRTQGQRIFEQLAPRLDPGARDLLEAYFGLGPWTQLPLLPLAALRTHVRCLRSSWRHPTLAVALLWAWCDPAARQWVAPTFYATNSTA
jgi:hypothetical protein